MIYLQDNIRCQNVISKRCCVNGMDVGACLRGFYEEIKGNNIKIRGPVMVAFYDINENGPVDIEVFVPVFSSEVIPKNMNFNSYYSIENMASTVVKSNIEKNLPPSMNMLISAMNTLEYTIISPVYVIYESIMNKSYATIKVAYSKK